LAEEVGEGEAGGMDLDVHGGLLGVGGFGEETERPPPRGGSQGGVSR
jgi:hypothetical protein